ncbi:MAG: hypothetical protein Q9P01_19520 [Anaerolineae bacterium]|nr:hypothetical protein [Anaerolineae bacterium]MDQ7036941.1 hypothetical protein [Anaerolineae bacterium]
MSSGKQHYDPILLATLNMLGVASLIGVSYCLFALLSGLQPINQTDVALYLLWFTISVLSVYVMRLGDIWGAYALGIATGAITIYDFARGMATLGGATLGILVILIIYSYIQETTPLGDRTQNAA